MFADIIEHRAALQYTVIVALALACLVWGKGPERIAGTVLLAMPFAEVAYHLLLGPQTTLSHTDVGHAIMQVVVAIPFLGLALFANRRYPLWLVSFQLIAVLSHLVRGLLPPEGGVAYLIMTVGPSYGMIAALAVGLVSHIFRTRRFGPYRSWRTSSLRSSASGRSSSPKAS
jgi:hypothetical protein